MGTPTQKSWIIYCHVHVETGRRYVGLTTRSMERRWSQHLTQSKILKTHFANAIRKYGLEAFSHEILEVCHDQEVAELAERSWIELFDSTNPEKGFNLAKGGDHIILDAGDPDHRERVSRGVRVSLRDPIVQANRAAASREMWQDPRFAKKVTRGITKAWQDPDYQARMSFISREINSRPEVRKAISEAASRQSKTSHFRGVCWNRQLGQWRAFLRANGKMHNLGHFRDEDLAARAHDQKALELFGSGAQLNFPT